MMDAPWIDGGNALVAALLFTPLVRNMCVRLRLYDQPGPLKIHSHPIPRLGGISLALALGLGISCSRKMFDYPSDILFDALTLIWLTGLVDDLRGLSPWVRLVAQIASATLLWHGGWEVPFLGGALSWMAVCLLVSWFVNAMNFLDGSDGLAAGTAAVIAVGFVALPAGMLSHLGVAVAWSLLGASLGFLRTNFPPADCFMGDSGSLVLGFFLAFLALDSFRAGGPGHSLPVFPFLFAAVPLLDAALAISRRLLRGGSPLMGDRSHFYDLLSARGWSKRRVALASYSITAALVIAGWWSVRTGFAEAILISAICLAALLAAAVPLGSLRSDRTDSSSSREKAPPHSGNWLPSKGVITDHNK
jgi:UDP-GlcNAc:undecaprenyl-phosphate/decaprenyl-phosphate GlcNAc-1-phosphate transferase